MVILGPEPSRLLAPLQRKTVTEALVERMAELVAQGIWKPGDILPHENELAITFNVGRTTVREALKVLSYMGYLESASYKGYRVSSGASEFLVRTISWAISLGRRDYQELIQARLLIEPALAGLTAQSPTEETLARLETCVQRMEQSAAAGDEEEYLYADRDFHVILAEACGNRVLFRIAILLRDFLWQSLRIPHSTGPSLNEHQVVLEAVRRRDSEAARRAMQVHIQHIAERQASAGPASG
jgi:DNA-binding FadR family transcriptional regulator